MSSSKGGRTIFIFLILIVVILISGMSISLFFLQKETQARKSSELLLEESQARNVKIGVAFKEAEKQIDVLKGKNKDADDKINGLMEDLDLKTALSEEIKAENKKLKDLIEAEGKSKEEIRQKLTAELESVRSKLKDFEAKEKSNAEESASLRQNSDDLRKKNEELEVRLKDMEQSLAGRSGNEVSPVAVESGKNKVNLDRIVITPETPLKGRVLNVDTETEFLIFDIGLKSGIKQGDVMSVYRGPTFLGDVKVSRVQDEMSAADFISPLSSRNVRKGDQVVPKR